MSDVISRADAIDAVWKLDKDANEYVVDDAKEIHGYCTAIGVCVGELSKLPSAEAEWIPCSERLPSEKDGRVLVTKRGKVMTAIYSEFSGTWYLGEMCAVGGEDPIAWMPLPKPYREDGEV